LIVALETKTVAEWAAYLESDDSPLTSSEFIARLQLQQVNLSMLMLDAIYGIEAGVAALDAFGYELAKANELPYVGSKNIREQLAGLRHPLAHEQNVDHPQRPPVSLLPRKGKRRVKK
jgi:hypothetical protein